MGTTYGIAAHRDGYDNLVELDVDEHSNLLDIVMRDARLEAFSDPVIRNLHPEQVLAIAAELVNVASYWMDDSEFEEKMRKHFGDQFRDDPRQPWVGRLRLTAAERGQAHTGYTSFNTDRFGSEGGGNA